MGLPYPTKVILPFDIATAQDMNERHANDVALANGSGLDDGAVTADKIDFTTFTAEYASNTNAFNTTSTTPVLIPGTAITVTVPQGVSRIEITATVRISNTVNFLTTNLEINKNGSSLTGAITRNLTGGSSAWSDTVPMQFLDSVTPGQTITYDLRMFTSGIAGRTDVNGVGGASIIVKAVG